MKYPRSWGFLQVAGTMVGQAGVLLGLILTWPVWVAMLIWFFLKYRD